MIIREATTTDATAYRSLRERIDSETDTWGADPGERFKTEEDAKAVIEESAAQENSFLWLVEDADELIGFLHVKGLKWRRARHTVGLDIGIVKVHWGRGIANELFSRLEKWAVDNGILRVEFFVCEGNERARTFYQKWGYREEGVRTGSIYVNGILSNEIWMSKILNS